LLYYITLRVFIESLANLLPDSQTVSCRYFEAFWLADGFNLFGGENGLSCTRPDAPNMLIRTAPSAHVAKGARSYISPLVELMQMIKLREIKGRFLRLMVKCTGQGDKGNFPWLRRMTLL